MGISPFRPQKIFLRRFFSKWVDKNNPLLYMGYHARSGQVGLCEDERG
jgi:hypothetical protein